MKTPKFRYTEAKSTIYKIPVGIQSELCVIGDPENASYEWILISENKIYARSDDGYGSPEAALRDGLNEFLS